MKKFSSIQIANCHAFNEIMHLNYLMIINGNALVSKVTTIKHMVNQNIFHVAKFSIKFIAEMIMIT